MLTDKKGFTLIELLIVIIVIAVLAGVGVPTYSMLQNRARESATKAVMRSAATGIALYADDYNSYPAAADIAALAASISTYYANMKTSDSWGTLYTYSLVSGTYTFKSFGIDKLENTADDIIFENGIMTADGKYKTGGTTNAAEILFSSAFDNMNGIKNIMGSWSANGSLNSSPSNSQNRAVFGDIGWTDYEIKTNAILTSGSGYGIYYRSTVPNNSFSISGFIFQFDAAKKSFLVNKLIGGVEQSPPVITVKMPTGFSIYNASHEITVSVSGDRHIIKVDGVSVLDFIDSSFTSGQAGVRSWSSGSINNSVSFDNMEVTKIH